MPTIPFVPENTAGKDSTFGSLDLRNVYVRLAPRGAAHRFELRSRTGLTDYLYITPDDIRVPPTDAPPEGPDFIQAIFSSPEVAGGFLYYQAFDRLYSVSGTNQLRSYPNMLPAIGFGGSREFGPRFVPLNQSLAYLNGGLVILDDEANLTEVTLPPITQIADIAYLNGRLVVVEAGSGRFGWTNPFAFTTLPALNFATAEAAGDNLLGVEAMNEEIWLFGSSTIERYTDTGSAEPSATFQRSPGGVINMGVLSRGAKIQTAGALVWVCERTEEYKARQVFMSQGGPPQAIPNSALEDDLDALTYPEKQSVFMWSYGEDGDNLVVLDCDGKWTWVLSTRHRTWTKYDTSNDPNWEANGSAAFFGVDLFGSRRSATIMRPVTTELDGNRAFNKVASVQIPHLGDMRSLDALGVNMAGMDDTALMTVELSDDNGATWRDPLQEVVEADPAVWTRPIWWGLGPAEPGGLGIRITWTTASPRAVSALHINEAAYA